MKQIALILGIVVLAFFLCSGLAFAQQEEYEVVQSETGEQEDVKQIEIRRTMMSPMDCMAAGMTGGGVICCAGECGMAGAGMGGMMCCGSHGSMMCGPGMMGGRMGGCPPPGGMMQIRMMRGGDDGGMMGGLVCGKLRMLGCVGDYEKCADQLELSDKQLEALREIRLTTKKGVIQKMADIKIAELELGELLKQDDIDFSKVKAKISEIASLREDICISRVSSIQTAQKVLTKEQLAKLKACKKGSSKKKGSCGKKESGAMKHMMKKGEEAGSGHSSH